jgi:RNA ligase (TIGR02306 family)
MRRLATIEVIASISAHPNADALELATVRGWQCVVKKGKFSAGDYCVYVKINSVLPERPEFEFMRHRNFRVRTIKLRGELSQGIVFPLSICDTFEHVGNLDFKVGDDVTNLLEIKLYTPPVPSCLSGDTLGSFPTFFDALLRMEEGKGSRIGRVEFNVISHTFLKRNK